MPTEETFPQWMKAAVFQGPAGQSLSVRPKTIDHAFGGLCYHVVVTTTSATMSASAHTDSDAFLVFRDGLEGVLRQACASAAIRYFYSGISFKIYLPNEGERPDEGERLVLKGEICPLESSDIPTQWLLGAPVRRDVSFSFGMTRNEVANAIDQLSEIVRYIDRSKKRFKGRQAGKRP